MSEFLNPVQSAIFTRLSAQVTSATIYDDVPDLPEGKPDENYPYVVIGEDVANPWDTDNSTGNEIRVNLHVFSYYQGKKQTKTILGEIYTALHRQAANLSATGYTFTDCLFDFAEVNDNDDGAIRHGVCRYRVTIEKE